MVEDLPTNYAIYLNIMEGCECIQISCYPIPFHLSIPPIQYPQYLCKKHKCVPAEFIIIDECFSFLSRYKYVMDGLVHLAQ